MPALRRNEVRKIFPLCRLWDRSLFIRGAKHGAPVALRILRDLDLPWTAAHRAVLDVGLRAAAALVEGEIHGFTADENADHDNDEVNRDRESVGSLHMFVESARDHVCADSTPTADPDDRRYSEV